MDVVHFPAIGRAGFQFDLEHYVIKNVEEARAYLDHSVLGPRLLTCAQMLIRVESLFDRLLEEYFRGARDGRTLGLLGIDPEAGHLTRCC